MSAIASIVVLRRDRNCEVAGVLGGHLILVFSTTFCSLSDHCLALSSHGGGYCSQNRRAMSRGG